MLTRICALYLLREKQVKLEARLYFPRGGTQRKGHGSGESCREEVKIKTEKEGGTEVRRD